MEISIPHIRALDLGQDRWDVAVAGAGPAGAVAAALLARMGFSVLLLDRAVFPRPKVCGDGLVVDALRSLSRLGMLRDVAQAGRLLGGATIVSPSRNRVTAHGVFLTCRRELLDAMLVQKAVASGAVLAQGEAAAVDPAPGGLAGVRVRGREAPFTARVALVATGIRTGLFRGLVPAKAHRPSAAAIRCYVSSDEPLDRMLIVEDRTVLPGYGWIFPMRDNVYNVGVGAFYKQGQRFPDLKRTFARFTADFPEARRLMDRATSVTALEGGALRCNLEGVPPIVRPNVLALGEALGATYACIGEGIGSAMETGEYAAQAVASALGSGDPGALALYPRLIESHLRPRHKSWKLAQRTLARAWLNDLFMYRAGRDPHMQMAMERILNDTMNPIHVLWFKGAVQDWLDWPKRTLAHIRQRHRERARNKRD